VRPEAHSKLAAWAAFVTVLVIGAANVCAIVAMWVAGEWKLPSPGAVVDEPLDEEPTATTLRKRIAVHYFWCYERNRHVTDRRAGWVEFAQYALLTGILLGATVAVCVVGL
jgi:hypothetical protein